jgi:hypothetical protein
LTLLSRIGTMAVVTVTVDTLLIAAGAGLHRFLGRSS